MFYNKAAKCCPCDSSYLKYIHCVVFPFQIKQLKSCSEAVNIIVQTYLMCIITTHLMYYKLWYIFTIRPCWSYPRILNPGPGVMNFTNKLGREFHENHNREFSVYAPYCNCSSELKRPFPCWNMIIVTCT